MNETVRRGRRPSIWGCIGRALLYLLLFLGWQTVVSTAYTYSAFYEQSVGGVLPGEYLAGQRAALIGAAVLGVLIVAVVAVVMRARRSSPRRLLGLKEETGGAVTALAVVAAGVCAVGVVVLLGDLAWRSLVGSLHFASLTLEGQVPDIAALYDAMLSKTGEISAISAVLTLVTLALCFRLRRKSLREEVWLRRVPGKVLAWGAGMAFCLYWLVTVVLSLLPEAWMENYLEASEGLFDGGAILFIATAFFAPVVEEVIFRGLIYTRLRRGLHPMAAVVGSALLFGYCHGEFVWFCYAFVLGFIFAQVTRCTNSLLPALVMHVVFNLTNEILTLFGDWQPGTAAWVVMLAVGVGGSLFCTLGLRNAIGQIPAPCGAAEIPPLPVGLPVPEESVHRESVPVRPAAPARLARAAWDADSGPDHKFPPHMR